MAAPFDPPSPSTRLPIPKWIPPATTKADLDYAKLHTIDLSLLDSPDPLIVEELVRTTKEAIREDGFLFLVNYGVSLEQLHRQFDLAYYLHNNISEEDKERLHWNPQGGTFAGYKPRYGWQQKKGKLDGIEQFNFYDAELRDHDKVPTVIRPYMDEIVAFSDYLSHSVNKRLLTLLSRALELPDNYLYDKIQSHEGIIGQGYFRHALFHPLEKETKESSGGLRMHGHTDYGTTTLLFSVPITCLQIWGNDEKWRYVKYNPGALVVNIGETLEILSGGHFKATRHRVFEPPEDQRHEQRLSLVQFNASAGDMRMSPAYDSPLLQREGTLKHQGVYCEFQKLIDAGVPVPTNKMWREAQVSSMRETTDQEHNKLGADRVMVNGKLMSRREFHGVPVLLPV